MMPTSARHNPPRDAGFSLLEVLVVLAILGLSVALVAPRMVTAVESARFSAHLDTALSHFTGLRAEAAIRKRATVISLEDENMVTRLGLPDGWTVTGDTVSISRTGYCTGGRLTFTAPDNRAASFRLSPPNCKAERMEGPAS